MERILFCPNCTRFVGQRDQCVACGWVRPAIRDTQIEICWTARLNPSDMAQRGTPFPARFTVVGQNLIVPTADGTIYALDLDTGKIIWQQPIDPQQPLRTLAVTGWHDLLLLGAENLANLPTHDRALLAWDAATGKPRWRWSSRGDNLSVPLVIDHTAYFTTSEPQLYALDLQNQSLLWSAETGAWSPDAAASARDILVVPSRGPEVSAYARANGQVLWSFCAQDQEMETLHLRPAVSSELAILSGWGKRLYAVDLQTGAPRWVFSAERGITSAPLLLDDLLLVGVKDFRAAQGSKKPGYGLYALDIASGTARWKFPTGKHIYSTPVTAGSLVIFGADDQRLHAVERSSGQEAWQYPLNDVLQAGPYLIGQRILIGDAEGAITCLYMRESMSAMEAGTPELARASQLALDGQYEEAARVYASNDRPAFAAALYWEAGQHQAAAALYSQQQDWEKALAVLREAADSAGEGAILARLGRHDEAARILETGGHSDAAIREYIAAGRAGYAAQLLWKSGKRQEAAELFRSIHQEDQAAEILVEDGRAAEAAQIYVRMGKLAEAASVYAQAGLLLEAARLNEELGQFAAAAKQYAAGGASAEALRLFEQLEDWQQVAGLAQQLNDLPRQARALKQLGRIDEAALLYEQAGELSQALELYETSQRWEQAANLAGSLELWDRQAGHYASMGLMAQAGESYERAAAALLAQEPQAEEALGNLYEAAARSYADAGLWPKHDACWDRVCQYRKWPNIRGTIQLPAQVVQGEYCLVILQLSNTGYSTARNLQVTKLSSKFQLDVTETQMGIRSLSPQQQRQMPITVMPGPNVVGMVILRVTLHYQDINGGEHDSMIEERARVLGRDEKLHVLEQFPTPDDFTVDHSPEVDFRKLRSQMIEYFSEEDLQDLCFDLRIDYETLSGETKTGKSRELILFMGKYGRIQELLEICRQKRPNVSW